MEKKVRTHSCQLTSDNLCQRREFLYFGNPPTIDQQAPCSSCRIPVVLADFLFSNQQLIIVRNDTYQSVSFSFPNGEDTGLVIYDGTIDLWPLYLNPPAKMIPRFQLAHFY